MGTSLQLVRSLQQLSKSFKSTKQKQGLCQGGRKATRHKVHGDTISHADADGRRTLRVRMQGWLSFHVDMRKEPCWYMYKHSMIYVSTWRSRITATKKHSTCHVETVFQGRLPWERPMCLSIPGMIPWAGLDHWYNRINTIWNGLKHVQKKVWVSPLAFLRSAPSFSL
ncbi:hypothetical protein CBR_g45438 [Chara braunii]|uniref:Uncharacterized protein n=1 Tax=Chara braunii TaxID=69332 RepID=A0A388LYN9_CHABU|nr:hypothetical protein CBR_g45438 [Chara braunii]|eukprot:GBG87381.1 hypothetical protein CBR_g45438 [Chara braunii]